MVKEEASESSFQQNALKQSFANNHTEELEICTIIHRIISCWQDIWEQFPIILCFDKICILCIEYLFSQLGHELFEKTTTVDAIFDLKVLVNELDLKVAQWVNTL